MMLGKAGFVHKLGAVSSFKGYNVTTTLLEKAIKG